MNEDLTIARMGRDRHSFSWCTCPYCPQNADNQPRYISSHYVPSYQSHSASHRSLHCAWCDLWRSLMPSLVRKDFQLVAAVADV